jgi:hypothetical protein
MRRLEVNKLYRAMTFFVYILCAGLLVYVIYFKRLERLNSCPCTRDMKKLSGSSDPGLLKIEIQNEIGMLKEAYHQIKLSEGKIKCIII